MDVIDTSGMTDAEFMASVIRGLMAAEVVPGDDVGHEPVQIGTHNADGSRTHAPPGEVCAGCSDPAAGRWVPVNMCRIAWAEYERREAAGDFGAWRWIT